MKVSPLILVSAPVAPCFRRLCQGAFYILSYPLVEFLNQGSSKLLTFDNEVRVTYQPLAYSTAEVAQAKRTRPRHKKLNRK